MTEPIEFTGERFVPGIAGEIEFEHVHRYAFARRFVAGRRVLDAACGEGYGSALLAAAAREVTGVDIDAPTLAHATTAYAGIANLVFRQGSATALPFADASFDAIVSFETIEHLPAAEQPAMVADFARVLAPGGLLILSAPNRVEYSERRGYANPFHQHEHDRGELDALLAPHFAWRRFHHQRTWLGSALWNEAQSVGFEAAVGDPSGIAPATPPPAMYFVVLAARTAADLPQSDGLSLFSDAAGGELARLQAQGGQIIRLDTLLAQRTTALDHASAHVTQLEALVGQRERLVVERDAQLAAQVVRLDAFARQEAEHAATLQATRNELAHASDENARLQAAVTAQERIIAYRGSARWWLRLPAVRLRTAWQRLRG